MQLLPIHFDGKMGEIPDVLDNSAGTDIIDVHPPRARVRENNINCGAIKAKRHCFVVVIVKAPNVIFLSDLCA
jgi:hypothetical protein